MKAGLLSRLHTVGISFTLLGVMIVGQMARIQHSASGKALEDIAQKTYESEKVTLYPERGNIYDRWGNLLAGNQEVYEVGLNLIDVTDPATIAQNVSEILGVDYKTALEKASLKFVKGEQEYVTIEKFVEPDQIAELEKRVDQYKSITLTKSDLRKGKIPPSLNGLEWRPRLQRSYPEKSLGANIIGFYSFLDPETGKPYFGVEEKYNDLLAGTPIEATYYYDPNKASELPTVPPGASLVLTIDREIQASVEQILDNAVESNKAESGTIVVMDPKTGEILAMAATPRIDLNQYWKLGDVFSSSTPFNRVIGQTYEPGSVFKVLTMASALDAGTVTPDTVFTDTGVFSYGGYNIYNWDRGAWGPQTMTGCMQHSLNVCLSWVSTSLGASKFYSYMKDFGIGHRTNIDLAGEVTFPLSVPGDPNWAEINLATNSFGQGLAATPIQMITAISAVANDGKMMAPHVLKAVIENGYQREVTPTVIGRPIKAKTAHTETDMLAISLEEEASSALVDGYRVAGKTGTGEIPSESGYIDGLTNASFVGWGPVDDPRFIVYVWLEKPKSSIWGSVVASPVFKDVVTDLVKLIDLPPDAERWKLYGKGN